MSFFEAPALSWYAMLNMTKLKLELVLDPDMYIFSKKGMIGGVSYILIDTGKPKIRI